MAEDVNAVSSPGRGEGRTKLSTSGILQSFCKGLICYMGAELPHPYHPLTAHHLHHNSVVLGIKFQNKFWRAHEHPNHSVMYFISLLLFPHLKDGGTSVSYFKELWIFKTKIYVKHRTQSPVPPHSKPHACYEGRWSLVSVDTDRLSKSLRVETSYGWKPVTGGDQLRVETSAIWETHCGEKCMASYHWGGGDRIRNSRLSSTTWLCEEFGTSLGHMRSCLKIKICPFVFIQNTRQAT